MVKGIVYNEKYLQINKKVAVMNTVKWQYLLDYGVSILVIK